MRMRQLMDGNRGARWPSGRVKIAIIDLVEAAEIIHAHQIASDVDEIPEIGAEIRELRTHVLQHAPCLRPNVQGRCAHDIRLGSGKGVIRPPRGGARYKDEIGSSPG